jgi:conjugative relaxase-like TrwC/TraI family protein
VVLRPAKSVSLLYGLGNARVAAQVLDAHQRATSEALSYLEDHVGARRGHGGCDHVQGSGLVAVGFDHRTLRAGDPLLHTHVIVANRVQGPIAGGPRLMVVTCTGTGWRRMRSTAASTSAR